MLRQVNRAEPRARVGRPQTSSNPQYFYCWPSQGGSSVVLFFFFFFFLAVVDVVGRYISLFLLHINIKIGKNRY